MATPILSSFVNETTTTTVATNKTTQLHDLFWFIFIFLSFWIAYFIARWFLIYNELGVCVCVSALANSNCVHFLQPTFFSFHFVFINFNSKVRSSFQLGCAAFNLICLHVQLCCAELCVRLCIVCLLIWCAQAVEKKVNWHIAWQAGPGAHWTTSPACTRTNHSHKLHVHSFFSVFICKRINLLHICGNHRVREARRWMNVMNNKWIKKHLFVKQRGGKN